MAELIKSVKALGEAITGEKIEGDTLFAAVKDAGEKMTGKELEGKELNDIIAETADAYEGGGGTEVIANPELSGDEPNLEGLQVGDLKYKVPSGSGTTNLYLHSITIFKENGCSINFSFINSTSTQYDENGLFSLLMGSRIPCSGIVIDNGFKNVLNCEFSQLFKINIYYFATNGKTITTPYQLTGKYSIKDKVKQLM